MTRVVPSRPRERAVAMPCIRALSFVVDALALGQVGGTPDVVAAVRALEDADETGVGDRRWCLTLRLACILTLVQGHSPRPVRGVRLARSSRMAEAPGSRTQPSRDQREATDFEDREGHRAPFASVAVRPRLATVRGIIPQPPLVGSLEAHNSVAQCATRPCGNCGSGVSKNAPNEERGAGRRRTRTRPPAPRESGAGYWDR
jgi:hypothetical protein